MIRYQISCPNPHRHFIHFKATFPCSGDELQVQLPAWRPGRYELGNFARNLRQWQAQDADGKNLPWRKATKDLWIIETKGVEEVVVSYDFYANELNAGSTFLDETQLYINPVNCFFYNPWEQQSGFELALDLPEDYEICTGMDKPDKHKLVAKDVQQLMDCPLIASNSLTHLTYNHDSITYHIWVQGKLMVDSDRFIEDHRRFTEAQVKAFVDIPCSEYHFIYQIPAHFVRHGVEHENSTVIAMGPDHELLNPVWYNELIGISCHELYHTWNIKNIRPADMMPYDFSKENYSRLGYVAEGVTTYYGDQYLHRCEVFDDQEYFRRLAQLIERHTHNFGRFNLSVADSSFDTWLDGYVPGIPWRKVSIYNEGALCSFICDARIIAESDGQRSLDDVMKLMYERKGKSGEGYTEDEYKGMLEEVGGCSFDDIFENLIWGTSDYWPYLLDALNTVGLKVEQHANSKPTERFWGIKLDDQHVIRDLAPDSPGDKAGLWIGDKLVAFNGKASRSWRLELQQNSSGEIAYLRRNQLHSANIETDGEDFYWEIQVEKADDAGFYDFWKNRN